MTIDMNDPLSSILSSIARIDYVRPKDIPNIDLYMDQVTTFMEEQLQRTKRYDDDKILTKTMINNYAKNNLLPPPVKKKYSKEHVLVMIFIYYFKSFLSIKDIEHLLSPITEKCFAEDPSLDMTSIYEEICQMEKSRVGSLQEDIQKSYGLAQDSFAGLPEDDREYLQKFAFICNLSFDVYVKKLILEKLIDEIPETPGDKKKKK